MSKPCIGVSSESGGRRVKPYPTRGVQRRAAAPGGTIQNKPALLLKQVILYKKEMAFTGNSSFTEGWRNTERHLEVMPVPWEHSAFLSWAGESGAAALSNCPLPNLVGRVKLRVIKFLFCSLPTSLGKARIVCSSALLLDLLFPFPFPSVFAGRRNKKKGRWHATASKCYLLK